MAIPHMGSHGPCRCTNCSLNAARRRGDEAGRIRLFTSSYDAVSPRTGSVGIPCPRLWLMARSIRLARTDRHHLWSDGRSGAKRLQVRRGLFECEPHGFRAVGPDDVEPDRAYWCGTPDVFARDSGGPVICRSRTDGLRQNPHPRSGPSREDESLQVHSVRGRHVRHRQHGVDRPTRLQWICGGATSAYWCMARLPGIRGRRRIWNCDWRRLYLARNAKSVHRQPRNRRRQTASPSAADLNSRTHRCRNFDRRKFSRRALSTIALEPNHSSSELAAVRRHAERQLAMIVAGYSALFQLILPQVIGVIAALGMLAFDLLFLRRLELRT